MKAVVILALLIFVATLFLGQAEQAFPTPLPSVSSSTAADAHDFSKTVLPITELKLGRGIEGRFGTGFCLDPACRFIGTNYHIAKMARPRKIAGDQVIQRYLATGPDDVGATVNDGPSLSPMKYTLSRDLAIFELHHSLPHHHGAAFSLHDLQVGQEIDIYAYPKESINPIRSLVQFHGAFKGQTTTGLLAFDYSLSADKAIRPGASGGIVVDRESQQIVGILNGIAENGEAIALAVPVQSLIEFVTTVQPFLSQTIFPSTQEISPVSADLYPKYVPASRDVLQHRPEEPAEVKALRSKAQLLADSMRNFIAVQGYAWGSGDRDPEASAAYQVRVIDGVQQFRRYPDGKNELKEIPQPQAQGWVTGSDEWSQLPKMVGTEYRLKVQQAPDVVLNRKRMKVFRYYSSVEDNLCPFAPIADFGVFVLRKTVAVACYGEAWTDQDMNIIRISLNLDLSEKLKSYRGWEEFQVVITYGRLQRENEPERLVPRTIFTQGRDKKHAYWCRGQFTDYQIFAAEARLLPN